LILVVIVYTMPVLQAFSRVFTAKKALTEYSSLRTSKLTDSLISGFNNSDFMTRKGFRIIDEMLDDEQIRGILELKKSFVISPGFRIETSDTSKLTNGDEIKEFIEKNLSEYYRGTFQDSLYEIMSAMEYGFSLTEKLYEIRNGKLCLANLKTVPPHSIDFETDTLGNVSKIIQRGTDANYVELPIWKFIHYINTIKFGNPYGVSDMQSCYRAWIGKKLMIKYWLIYGQRFASPFPVGKVPSNAGQDMVDRLTSILDSIQQTVSIVIPKEAEVELHKAASGSRDYEIAINSLSQMISRALLLPDLLGMGANIESGAYNLGLKHFEIFEKHILFIQNRLADMVNDQIIKPLIIYNYGELEEYPVFKFQPYKDENYIDVLKIFLQSQQQGMPITNKDYDHFRKLIKFPEFDGDPLEKEVQNKLSQIKEDTEDLVVKGNYKDINRLVLSNSLFRDLRMVLKAGLKINDEKIYQEVGILKQLLTEKTKKAVKDNKDLNFFYIDTQRFINKLKED